MHVVFVIAFVFVFLVFRMFRMILTFVAKVHNDWLCLCDVPAHCNYSFVIIIIFVFLAKLNK